MQYTVKQLSILSGVSIRTLHYYDEIGLLKPASVSESGYRYYQESELLSLQQILFFKELGFELRQIQAILKQSNIARVDALKSQKQLLLEKTARIQTLISTIDTTIKHLKEKQAIKDAELFKGFEPDSEQQKRYEKYIQEYLSKKYGKEAHETIAQGYKDTKHWTQKEWQQARNESTAIAHKLLSLMQKEYPADSEEVQHVIAQHHAWIQQFWMLTKKTYKEHANFIMNTELKQFYDAYHPQLAAFMAQAIRIFAERKT